MYSFNVIREGVGRRTLELNQLMFEGRVVYVDRFEMWVLPRTSPGEAQRLCLVGKLKDGETVVFETTTPLFADACDDLHQDR